MLVSLFCEHTQGEGGIRGKRKVLRVMGGKQTEVKKKERKVRQNGGRGFDDLYSGASLLYTSQCVLGIMF